MVGVGRTILAAAFATGLISSPVAAQNGSVSLVHTVTVTVPPRVKVQVGSFSQAAPAVRIGNLESSTQGLSVSVNATQAWTLSVAAASDAAPSSISWSRYASASVCAEHAVMKSASPNAPRIVRRANAERSKSRVASMESSPCMETTSGNPSVFAARRA